MDSSNSAMKSPRDTPVRSARDATVHSVARVVAAALAAAIVLCPFTAAASAAGRVANPPGSGHSLVAQVINQLRHHLPAAVRIDAVKLGCNPPPGATLKSVAPGVSVLHSRGFLVEITAAGRPMVCSAVLDAKRPVLTAKRNINPGRPVSRQDFTTAWVDAFGGALGALRNFPSGGPYVSASRIIAASPLYPTQLRRPLAVHPGDMVTVVVRNGPVILRTELEARAAASVGQTAPMVNPHSGAVVDATVTGVRTAQLVLQ